MALMVHLLDEAAREVRALLKPALGETMSEREYLKNGEKPVEIDGVQIFASSETVDELGAVRAGRRTRSPAQYTGGDRSEATPDGRGGGKHDR